MPIVVRRVSFMFSCVLSFRVLVGFPAKDIPKLTGYEVRMSKHACAYFCLVQIFLNEYQQAQARKLKDTTGIILYSYNNSCSKDAKPSSYITYSKYNKQAQSSDFQT